MPPDRKEPPDRAPVGRQRIKVGKGRGLIRTGFPCRRRRLLRRASVFGKGRLRPVRRVASLRPRSVPARLLVGGPRSARSFPRSGGRRRRCGTGTSHGSNELVERPRRRRGIPSQLLSEMRSEGGRCMQSKLRPTCDYRQGSGRQTADCGRSALQAVRRPGSAVTMAKRLYPATWVMHRPCSTAERPKAGLRSVPSAAAAFSLSLPEPTRSGRRAAR